MIRALSVLTVRVYGRVHGCRSVYEPWELLYDSAVFCQRSVFHSECYAEDSALQCHSDV